MSNAIGSAVNQSIGSIKPRPQGQDNLTMDATESYTDDSIAQFVKIILAVGFASTLVTANLTASKLAVYNFPVVGEVTGSVAAFMIGVSFLFSDLLSELYGKRTARYVVNASIVAVGLAFVLVFTALAMAPAESYALNSEFDAVFGASYPILTASILTLIVSQNLDVTVFHAVRDYTGHSHKWARNTISTGTSQFVDTALFTVLAFVALPPLFGQGTLPWVIVGTIIFTEYIIKLIIAGLDTAVFYAVSGYLERWNLTPV